MLATQIINKVWETPMMKATPRGWPGEIEDLVNPLYHSSHFSTSGYITPSRQDVITQLEYIKHLRTKLYKSLRKVRGHQRQKMFKMFSIFGLSSNLAKKYFSHTNQTVSTAIEASEVFAKSSNLQMVGSSTGKKLNVLFLGDASGGIYVAAMTRALKNNVELNWYSVMQNIAYEGTLRNFDFVNDLVYSIDPSRCILLSLNNECVAEEVSFCVADLAITTPDKNHAVYVDATGDEVQEFVENETCITSCSRAILWLKITKQIVKKLLKENGVCLIRANVKVLTRNDSLSIVSELMEMFENCEWISPTTAKDTGVLYLVLNGFKGEVQEGTKAKMFQTRSVRRVAVEDFNHMESYEGTEIPHPCSKFLLLFIQNLEMPIYVYITFMDSIITIMNMDLSSLHELGENLGNLREANMDASDAAIYQDASAIYNQILETQENLNKALYHKRLNYQSTPFEKWMTAEVFIHQLEKEKMTFLCSVIEAIKIGETNIILGTNQLAQFRKMRSLFWDQRNPKSCLLKMCNINIANINWQTLDNSCYEIIWTSRWCISSLVQIRAGYKKILMNQGEMRIRNYAGFSPCELCIKDQNKKTVLIAELQAKLGLHFVRDIKKRYMESSNSFHYYCFQDNISEFANQTDQKLGFDKALKLLEITGKMNQWDSAFICGFPLISRLHVGLIYLISTLFEQTRLIGCNGDPPLFGILLCNFQKSSTFKAVDSHVKKCIKNQCSEFVHLVEIDDVFSNLYLQIWNTHLLNQSIRVLDKNLFENIKRNSNWN